MTAILVTGAAGFIGAATAQALLDRGERVIGLDNLNDYYDPALKRARLEKLVGHHNFSFHAQDLTDAAALDFILKQPVRGVIHLAAQAGVRHSITHPLCYIESNITGTVTLLEAMRRTETPYVFVYASSSSVYGANQKLPFATTDRTDEPLSLYGATKKSVEMILAAYCSLYRIPATGLRFFTVYGPWGRPDMAPYLFTRAVLTGTPVRLFAAGELRRDFTYIDDIVHGVIAAFDRPPQEDGLTPPHRLYNLGNNHTERVRDFLAVIEQCCGRQAIIETVAMQPGDAPHTWADITTSIADLDYCPGTSIIQGIPRFVQWFRAHYQL